VPVAETWRVEPSGPLRGDITVRGSKNAVTKHMVAAMLGDGPSVIRNAPEVGDVDITAAMLESVGYRVGRADGEITVAPGDAVTPSVPEAFTGLNRIPILMLGPLLHVAGEAFGSTYAVRPLVPGWQPHFQVRTLTGYQPSLIGTFRFPEPFDRV
jgi:UDP-N-acetylglucosamine 1-carboxyvinyltransferase